MCMMHIVITASPGLKTSMAGPPVFQNFLTNASFDMLHFLQLCQGRFEESLHHNSLPILVKVNGMCYVLMSLKVSKSD